jgi:hypothetical protein
MRAVNGRNGAQPTEIIKEFIASVVLTMKYPKLIERFDHAETLADRSVVLRQVHGRTFHALCFFPLSGLLRRHPGFAVHPVVCG